jgi:hypothetical protein
VDTGDYIFAMMFASYNQCLFITASGHLGVGPSRMKPGDLVVILWDVAVPFVFRQEGDEFRLIGACYVYGVIFVEVSITLEALG